MAVRTQTVVSTSASPTTVLYSDFYTTSKPLSRNDTGRVLHCDVVISTTPPVVASDSIKLPIIRKFNLM